MEERYERKGKARPCFLGQDDLLALSHLIQETFTRPEVERYFRVSTNLGNSRVFSNSMGDFLVQKDLPDKVTDLSFWIEGWGHKTRFDRNVLLDFSKYSVQLQVEGIDPVWVYDKYNNIMKFLEDRTAWYWPFILLEKFILFSITMILMVHMVLSTKLGQPLYYLGTVGFVGVWAFLLFYDTRKIWPYSSLRLKGKESIFTKENVFMAAVLGVVVTVLVKGALKVLY